MKHFIATLEKRGEFYDAVILLSPTYPLRTAQNVRNFIKHYKKEKQHPLVSIKEPSTHPYLCYKKNKNNHIKSIFNLNGNNIYRRQQYPEYYEFTHHLCIFPTNLIYKLNAQLLCNETKGYVLKKDNSIIDIDNQIDLELAEFFLKKRKLSKKK